jgi:4'-phosphopantetheinyl transferase EntD
MIERLLPPHVVAVEAFADDPPPAGSPVFASEVALVAGAVPARRAEFLTTRRCAHDALARLGVPPAPILSGPAREPVWPAGVAGSLTHCDGYRAAAVARGGFVGIDAEEYEPLPPEVRDVVIGGPPGGDPLLDRVVFSAKEALYKAWFPRTGRWLDFTDARIDLDPAAGTFTAHVSLADPGFPPVVDGRFLVGRDLVLTAIVG